MQRMGLVNTALMHDLRPELHRAGPRPSIRDRSSAPGGSAAPHRHGSEPDLAPLVAGDSGEPGLVLSTAGLGAELFGDAGAQGPWNGIRALLLQRLQEAAAKGRPVILEAAHARRPWRLLHSRRLELPEHLRPARTRARLGGGAGWRWLMVAVAASEHGAMPEPEPAG
jgi:hypothetical protein